jgi:hypothetical protein
MSSKRCGNNFCCSESDTCGSDSNEQFSGLLGTNFITDRKYGGKFNLLMDRTEHIHRFGSKSYDLSGHNGKSRNLFCNRYRERMYKYGRYNFRNDQSDSRCSDSNGKFTCLFGANLIA